MKVYFWKILIVEFEFDIQNIPGCSWFIVTSVPFLAEIDAHGEDCIKDHDFPVAQKLQARNNAFPVRLQLLATKINLCWHRWRGEEGINLSRVAASQVSTLFAVRPFPRQWELQDCLCIFRTWSCALLRIRTRYDQLFKVIQSVWPMRLSRGTKKRTSFPFSDETSAFALPGGSRLCACSEANADFLSVKYLKKQNINAVNPEKLFNSRFTRTKQWVKDHDCQIVRDYHCVIVFSHCK